jgi:hypothetical protein
MLFIPKMLQLSYDFSKTLQALSDMPSNCRRLPLANHPNETATLRLDRILHLPIDLLE